MLKNKKIHNSIIIILAVVLFVIIGLSLMVEARYQTMLTGKGKASIAGWSFKLADSVPEIIDLAVTRTDSNSNVVQNRIAPGTYGEFEIGIDARGTETTLEYEIQIEILNKPPNLKFYSDSKKTSEIPAENNKIIVKKFMSLLDVQQIKIEKIYWEWAYETGKTEEEIKQNDIIDSQFFGETINMQIIVTGMQVLEESVYGIKLADVVAVGDYVNYNASSNGIKTFTSNDCLTGTSVSATLTTDEIFNSNALAQWRVLSVDKENGIVELIAVDPTSQTVTISGGDGFVNGKTVLNNIGLMYGQGKGAETGRSISIKDIENYSSYDPYTYPNEYSSTGYYGGTKEYSSGNFYKEVKDDEGNVIGYENTKTTASDTNKITMTQTSYYYTTKNYFKDTTVYNMIFKNGTDTSINKIAFWLASQSVSLRSSISNFRMRRVDSGRVDRNILMYSDGGNLSHTYTVLPIITLQTNVTTTGQDVNNVWQLDV